MRKLKEMAIGGAVTTVLALVFRLVFAEGEMSYVEVWGRYFAYLMLGMSIIIGLILMNPDLTTPIRLLGNGMFGLGFGGLVMNKFAELCATNNQPEASILMYEIIIVILLFIFSGAMYSRKPRSRKRR